MLEIGNGAFRSVAQARAHLSFWSIMKAPIIMGASLSSLTPEILDVLKNADALSINQDSLGTNTTICISVDSKAESTIVGAGIQAKRVASIAPARTKGAPADNQVVLAECKADDALQRWRFNSTSGLRPNFLYVAACDSTDSLQQWEVEGGSIRNKQTQRCLDSGEGHDPVGTAACSNTSSQQWSFELNDKSNSSRGQIRNVGAKECLNLPWNRGEC